MMYWTSFPRPTSPRQEWWAIHITMMRRRMMTATWHSGALVRVVRKSKNGSWCCLRCLRYMVPVWNFSLVIVARNTWVMLPELKALQTTIRLTAFTWSKSHSCTRQWFCSRSSQAKLCSTIVQHEHSSLLRQCIIIYKINSIYCLIYSVFLSQKICRCSRR